LDVSQFRQGDATASKEHPIGLPCDYPTKVRKGALDEYDHHFD
jgi:hypothetical protein